MKIKDSDTCYLCGKKACSSEHAPAKSFFPSNMRSNLIQVPSCKEHNEHTSRDDEYVRFIIASYLLNNQVGHDHSVNKSIKTILRSPALAKTLSENARKIDIVYPNSTTCSTVTIQIDRNRFDKEIKKIAYALYYHKYKKRWNRSLIIISSTLFNYNLNLDEFGELIMKTKYEKEAGIEFDYEGDNPEVFKYSFLDCKEDDDKILVMVFYEGFEIWVCSQFGTTGPSLIS